MNNIHSSLTISVTELKRNFASVLASAHKTPVAVLNHNRPVAYLLSARHYEQLLDALEDADDRKNVAERMNDPFVDVNMDEL